MVVGAGGVELDDAAKGILVEGRDGNDEVVGTSDEDDARDEGEESEGEEGSLSDSSDEIESRRREETGESSNSPSFPVPRLTLALLF